MARGAPWHCRSTSTLYDPRHRGMFVGKPVRRIVEIVDLSLRVRFGAARHLPDRTVRITGGNILVGNRECPCEVDALHLLWGLAPVRGNEEQSKHQYPDEIPHQYQRPHQRPLVICGCYQLPVEL